MGSRKLGERAQGLNLPSQTNRGGGYKATGAAFAGMALESLTVRVWGPLSPAAL